MSPARYAQHFLVNPDAIQRIVSSLNLEKSDSVLEIGPGRGALTRQLVNQVDHLAVVEVDQKMVDVLRSEFGKNANLTIHHQDILEIDFKSLGDEGTPFKIVGNLPYNLTSPILRRLSFWTHWSEAVLMVQKEVGDRLCAEVGTSEYGSLTVGVSLTSEIQPVFDLDEKAFRPPPRVLSSVVRLVRRKAPLTDRIEQTQKVVQAAFQQRRKTIVNSLSHGLHVSKSQVEEWLGKLGLEKTLRAQNIDPKQFVAITNLWENSNQE